MKRLRSAVAIFVLSTWAACGSASDIDGKKVYEQWCAACHAPGDAYAGTMALDARYKGTLPASLEERSDLSPEMVEYFVRNGVSIMPFFRKVEISDGELDALAAYLAKSMSEK
ncbi:cytochrome c [Pseudomonas putida]|uniref:c-type cytochrome n=1 Tax=Pseudomonas putida TaxID=303 RepID=UPI00226ECA68|nr:cytochrome c [Pseudomonas putida]WAB99250.1 cytochrome c [Pseudomonas putida]